MKLFRILIVDDEPHVVESLIRLIESNIHLPIDLYHAYNVADAMEIINKARIHLLITDIKMPGKTGLELAHEVNILWKECKIIIFTAYPNFDYAYKAYRNNVVNYILKTEDNSFIIETIKKTLESISQEILSKQILAYTDISHPIKIDHINRNQFFYLLNQEELSKEECNKLTSLLGFSDPEKEFYLFFAIVKPRFYQQLNMNQYPRYYMLLKELLNKMTQDILDWSVYEMDDFGRIIGLIQLNWTGEKSERINEIQWLNDVLESVQDNFKASTQLEVSFVFSTGISDIQSLPAVFSDGKMHLENLNTNTIPYIYKYNSVSENTKELDVHKHVDRNKENYKILYDALEASDSDLFFQTFDKLLIRIKKADNWQDLEVLEHYYSIILVILSYTRKHHSNKDIEFNIELKGLFHPQHFQSWKECTNNLTKLCRSLFDLIKTRQNDLTIDTVLFIKDYISSHITEDVSLIKLSEITGYNASYLSWLFSEQTGETISEYINNKRMELLHILLEDVNLNIGEVSTEMGFSSRAYFNQFVKKNVGMPPKKYRTKLLSNNNEK